MIRWLHSLLRLLCPPCSGSPWLKRMKVCNLLELQLDEARRLLNLVNVLRSLKIRCFHCFTVSNANRGKSRSISGGYELIVRGPFTSDGHRIFFWGSVKSAIHAAARSTEELVEFCRLISRRGYIGQQDTLWMYQNFWKSGALIFSFSLASS